MTLIHRSAHTHDIVTIGASAGGVSALRMLFGRIPPDFTATMFVVVHRSPFHGDHLAAVLRGSTQHRLLEPEDRERFETGSIYLAPRDQHLLVEEGRVRVVRDPKEHFTRPAIDPLFRSAAAIYGPRVVGVLLTDSVRTARSG